MCVECHYGSDNKLFTLEGEPIIAPNITFDPSGIGHYALQDFVTSMRTGKKPDGAQMKYPMMPHSMLTDTELNSMYEYLRSVPKMNSKKEL
ncbi:MAG: hypothetical protein FGM41_08140 [Bacteroidetes bacterium]|jgi:hypothetical protein|nr:hypothetical protein [Bacteroidota bacterium]